MQTEDRLLRRLKWIAILGPLLFLAGIELVRVLVDSDLLRAWPGYLLIAGTILIATMFFAEVMFGAIGSMQERLARQNRELLALHDAGIAITGDLDLQSVLQRVVDVARELGGARYGALSILGESGRIEAFLTSGIDETTREQIGPIPQGHGLLAAVIERGASLRMPDLTADPRSVGFPANHPPMHSLLAVPVRSRGRILGSFYLTEKQGANEFSIDDQQRLERFATQAAVAIENANLHHRVQVLAVTEERERIAREMHDTVAQVLGYVNIKAQAAQEHITRSQPDKASQQLSQLSSAAREAYGDLREAILGLRTSLDPDQPLVGALEAYFQQWERLSDVKPSFVVLLEDASNTDIDPLAELQALRVVQESLSNIRKHAQASEVCVTIRHLDNNLDIVVEDNGVGFSSDAHQAHEFPRFGLSTMRERAESVGGSLYIASEPGTGTRVRLSIPRKGRRMEWSDTG